MQDKQEVPTEENPMFLRLWDLKSSGKWFSHEIYAKTTRDLDMNVWNGKHPVELNISKHTCPSGSRVRVWMVSRFGDVGVTDNLINPRGYDARGLDADKDLKDYEFIELQKP